MLASLAAAALGLAEGFVAAADAPPAGSKPTPEQVEFFETRIRPLLVSECYPCHSHQASKLKGNLHLDSSAALLKGGDSGPAVVPGNPDSSLVVRAVRYKEQELAMPPKKRLSDAQIADVETWVRMGATWPDAGGSAATNSPSGYDWARFRAEHWAFRKVEKAPAPPVIHQAWVRSPIDAFVLARLEAAALKPAPPAEKRLLIRRAFLDLIGLPPTPEQVSAFLADSSPGAFAAVVDRLLASTQYGERWGRHWLDVARYSDGLGGFLDNDSLPEAWRYRDWVVAALNQDLPYNAFVKAQIAGDLISSSPEAGIATGFFAVGPTYNSDGGDPEAQAQAQAETLADRVDSLTRAFLGLTAACARCHDHKFDPISVRDYYGLAGIFNNTKVALLPIVSQETVQAYEAGQKAIKQQEETLRAAVAMAQERITRERSRESARYLTALLDYHRTQPATAGTNELNAFARKQSLNPETMHHWVELLRDAAAKEKLPGLSAWFDTKAGDAGGVTNRDALVMQATAFQEHVNAAWDQLDTREVVYASALASTKTDEERKKIAKPSLSNDDQKWAEILRKGPWRNDPYVAGNVEEREHLGRLKTELEGLKKFAPPSYAKAHRLAEAGTNDMAVAIRGDLRRPGEPAPRRFLEIVAGREALLFREGSGRRLLAEAVVDPGNPLTARVIVNRVWKHHFGQGLVRTPSNFGVMGEKPTHPELLDWLAATFVEEGWSLKALHRRILLSATWQMSSRHDAGAFAMDGENRLLWRMNPRKLEVESWRDSLLFVAGQLNTTLGGPSTEHILESPRRTLYATVSRNGDRFASDEFLRLFDFPAPRVSSESRASSTVPQQSLFAMNSPFMMARSKSFAERLLKERSEDRARLERAYQLLYGRMPSPDETKLGLAFLAGSTEGESKRRWESYAQVLLASQEFRQIQ